MVGIVGEVMRLSRKLLTRQEARAAVGLLVAGIVLAG